MATTTGQKWLIGCGIGCGVIVLVGVMLATGTCVLVKGVVEEFEEVKAGHDALVAPTTSLRWLAGPSGCNFRCGIRSSSP